MELANNIKQSTKGFYAYVRSKRKVKDTVGPLKDDTGDIIPPGKSTADELNNFFTSVLTEETENSPPAMNIFNYDEKLKLTDITVTAKEVRKTLAGTQSLESSKPR